MCCSFTEVHSIQYLHSIITQNQRPLHRDIQMSIEARFEAVYIICTQHIRIRRERERERARERELPEQTFEKLSRNSVNEKKK